MNKKFVDYKTLFLLGVIPLIALTDSALNGLRIGILLLILYIISSIITPILSIFYEPYKSIVIVIITTTIASIMNSFLNHRFHWFSDNLGIFIFLIPVNSLLINNLKNFNNIKGFIAGAKDFLIVVSFLLIIGFIREIFGRGTLLNQPLLNDDPESFLLLPFSSACGGFIISGTVWFFFKRGKE
uniref:Electron transport complex subunit RsxE n=1 Tax=candidate division WOR-3 bacterium TaxID=2052148 RepID=A0A7V3VUK0_UNCW3